MFVVVATLSLCLSSMLLRALCKFWRSIVLLLFVLLDAQAANANMLEASDSPVEIAPATSHFGTVSLRPSATYSCDSLYDADGAIDPLKVKKVIQMEFSRACPHCGPLMPQLPPGVILGGILEPEWVPNEMIWDPSGVESLSPNSDL